MITLSKKSKINLFAFSLSVFCFSIPSAQAGFQWIPAEKKEAPPAKPMPVPVPAVQQQILQNAKPAKQQSAAQAPIPIIPGVVQTSSSAPISVVPQESEQQPVSPPTPMPAMPQAPSASTGMSGKLKINPFPKNSDGFKQHNMQTSQKAMPQTQSASVSAPQMPEPIPNNGFAVVNGFGTDIPLALALRQVVPPAYAYSFGDGVNPGYRVSWEGGKPWNDVVNNMLAPLNLRAHITGKIIMIKSAPITQPQKISLKRQNITDPGTGESTVTTDAQQFEAQNWGAWSGDDLKTTLNAWSKKAGAQVQWQANQTYRLNNTVNVTSTFDKAVKALEQEGFGENQRPSIDIQNGGKIIIVRDQTA